MSALDPETEPLLAPGDLEKGSHDSRSELQYELYGYVLIVSSGLFFETMSMLVRWCTAYEGIEAKNIVFLRGLVQTALSLLSACLFTNRDKTLRVPRESWRLLGLRGLLGGMSLAFDFPMIKRVPLGPATSIYFLSPVFTLLLSITILQERINWREGFACALCFVGIVLVANPTISTDDKIPKPYLVGVLFGLFGAFLCACEITCVRVLAGRIHFITNVLAMGVGTLIAGLAMGGFSVPIMEKPTATAVAVFACCLGFLGQCLLNAGLKFSRASTGTILRNIDVPLGYCMGLFLGEIPKFFAILGSTLVLSGTAIVATNASRKDN